MRIIQTLKIKWFGSALLLLSALTLMQCSEEETPETFALNGEKFNVKDAKIYLVSSSEYNGYTYQDYIITDGTPTDVGSWSVEDYTDATFLVAIELGTQSEALAAGTYESRSSWSPVSVDNIAYLEYEVPAEGGSREYYTYSDEGAEPSIKVKGKFNGGDNISISLSGKIWDDSEGVLVSTKFNYSGIIEDVRP